jgi:hypothetical protein
MKTLTNEETRKKLLGQLRSAVCIQLAVWHICLTIEGLLDTQCDAVSRISQVSRSYSDMKIRDSHLKSILFAIETDNPESAAEGLNKIQAMENSTNEMRQQLQHSTQSAVWLHNAFLNEAESIAEIVGCGLDKVTNFLTEFTIEADLELEFLETDLKVFLGEPLPESEVSAIRTLKQPRF